MRWFLVFCSVSALNGLLFRSNSRLSWRLALPLRWARAVIEAPWARLCGLRPLGWARRGSSRALLLIRHNNRVHKVGLWLLPAMLGLTACALVAWQLDVPLHRLPMPGQAESAGGLLTDLSVFWQDQGRTGLVFLLLCLLLLPLCCLELPGALLLGAGGVGLRALLRALSELGLTWRTFSDGWFVSWLYGADGEAWLAGLFFQASLCQIAAALLFVLGLRGRPRSPPHVPPRKKKSRR